MRQLPPAAVPYLLLCSGTCLSLQVAGFAYQNNRRLFLLFLYGDLVCFVSFSFKGGISLLFSKQIQLHQGSGESQEEEPSQTLILNRSGSTLPPLLLFVKKGFSLVRIVILIHNQEGSSHPQCHMKSGKNPLSLTRSTWSGSGGKMASSWQDICCVCHSCLGHCAAASTQSSPSFRTPFCLSNRKRFLLH